VHPQVAQVLEDQRHVFDDLACIVEEGQPDFDWKGSESEAAEHMEEIAEIIRASNPDIVNLVEVENKQAVDKLNIDYLAGSGYVVYFKQGKDTYTG